MTPTLDNELDKKIKTIIAKLQRGSFYDSLDDSRRRLNKAEQSILSLLESEVKKAKIEQDKLSRGDEFLWFVRKLREYMNNTTSYKYKVFAAHFHKTETYRRNAGS